MFLLKGALGAASTGLTTEALKRVIELKNEDDTEVWGGYFLDSPFFNCSKIIVKEEILKNQILAYR